MNKKPDEHWEVRTPLLYGSKLASIHTTEHLARKAAENLVRRKYRGHGLQIHTRSRIIYIDHDED